MTTTTRPTESQRAVAAAYYADLEILRLRVLDATLCGSDDLAGQLTSEIVQRAPWLYKTDPRSWGGAIATRNIRALSSFDKADIQAARLAARLDTMARQSRGE